MVIAAEGAVVLVVIEVVVMVFLALVLVAAEVNEEIIFGLRVT